jgi:hypothetical protein
LAFGHIERAQIEERKGIPYSELFAKMTRFEMVE